MLYNVLCWTIVVHRNNRHLSPRCYQILNGLYIISQTAGKGWFYRQSHAIGNHILTSLMYFKHSYETFAFLLISYI